MLDRFSERARKTVALAREAAMSLQHEYIGTEHILLGLLNEGTGNALNALVVMEVDPGSIRAELNRVLRPGPYAGVADDLVLTPRATKALELAMDEAQRLGHDRAGTEHLLLGLIREEKGIAARALHNADVTLGALRASVVEVVGGMNIAVPAPPPPMPPREPLRIDLQGPVQVPASWTALVVLSDPTGEAREEAVGTVRLCWDSAGSPGPEWLPCDGRRIDGRRHAALATLLRTQGDPDLDEVRVPDFRGLRIGPGQPSLNAEHFCSSVLYGQGTGAAIRCWIKVH
jgi:hypothetical protein